LTKRIQRRKRFDLGFIFKCIKLSLWLIVNALMKLGQKMNEIFFKVFDIEIFYKFLKEKKLDVTKASELFGLKNGNYNQNGIYQSNSLAYSTEIVYLDFVILSNLYSIALSNNKLALTKTVHFVEGIPKKFLFLMDEKLNQLSYQKSNTKIEYEIDLIGFDRFLEITSKLLSCDNVSLISLSLATIGQFCGITNDSGLHYLLNSEELKVF
jgi:hypothetical protein